MISSADTAFALLQSVCIIIIAGVLGAKIAGRLGVPDIILLLLLGMALGPAGLALLHVPPDSVMSQLSLIAGASFILFEGGMQLSMRVLRKTMVTVVLLATVGVLITATAAGLAASLAWGLPLMGALLLGAVVAPTDPAALIPVFSKVKVSEKLKQTVIAESAFNDATGAILALSLAGMLAGGEAVSLGGALWDLVREAGVGLLVGVGIGYLLAVLTENGRFKSRPLGLWLELSPQLMLLGAISAYVLATRLHGSGFMAAFVAGLVLEGMDDLPTLHFVENLSALFRTVIFVILGSNVDFATIGANLGWGLLVVFVFVFLARPLTVFACALPDRGAQWTWRELFFICWVRETGVMPAALLGLLAAYKLPEFDKIYTVTFLAILFTIIVQAATTNWWARKLGLVELVEK